MLKTINLVTREKGALSVDLIESILMFDKNEFEESYQYFNNSINTGTFYPLITEEKKIKSLFVLTNGMVYPSSFRTIRQSNTLSENNIDMLTVIGGDKCLVPVRNVESILQVDSDEGINGPDLLNKAIKDGNLVPLVFDKDKIKSIVILSNGQVYPSTFNASTLISRIND